MTYIQGLPSTLNSGRGVRYRRVTMAGYEPLRLRLGLKGVEFPSFAARVSGCSQAH